MSGLKLDPSTGDYQVDANGKIVNSGAADDLLTPAYIRLKTPRGKWIYEPDSTFGSILGTLFKRVKEVVTIEAAAQDALQPMRSDGRAKSIQVEAIAIARGGVELKATIVDRRGEPQVLDFTPVGDDL